MLFKDSLWNFCKIITLENVSFLAIRTMLSLLEVLIQFYGCQWVDTL